jgi:hypothetical protein
MAAMLVSLTMDAMRNLLIMGHQHGGDDVT